MSFDAILFDFDGVLADTEPIHCSCWAEILRPFGIELTWDSFRLEFVGVSDRELIEKLCAWREPPIAFDRLWPEYDKKKALFRSRIAAEPPAILNDTAALIRELCSSYPLAVVTSSARAEIEPALQQAGIRDCFHSLVCGKEAARFKPAPDPYLLAAELLGSKQPLVVEDSDSGVASGRSAGFEVLRVSDAGSTHRQVRERLGLARMTSPG